MGVMAGSPAGQFAPLTYPGGVILRLDAPSAQVENCAPWHGGTNSRRCFWSQHAHYGRTRGDQTRLTEPQNR